MRKYFYFGLFIIIVSLQFTVAQDYVITRSNHVNIRTGPSMQAFVVGKSRKGDIYEMIGEEGEWFVIKLFSESPRYINKCCATQMKGPITDRLILPNSKEKCKSIYTSVQALRFRARREATELTPPTIDETLNMNMQHILEDLHILELFKIYNLNPAVFPVLIGKAVKNNW